jgi:5-methylcytosine-specific restriction protein B
MTQALTDDDLRNIFENQFRSYRDEQWAIEWRTNYVSHVERVRKADRSTWLDPTFQRMLWDENPVSNIGPGTSVTVVSAYNDKTLAARLFDLREAVKGDDLQARGTALQDAFDEILNRVYPAHAKRRPKARLVRLLALMFPHDMTCLMDAPRVWGLHRFIGAPLLLGDFVAQHAALRQRIRDAVGNPKDLAAEVDQSIFTWFLWNTMVKRSDEGAVAIDKGPKEANDVPSLSLLPANAQRRSLTCVRDNVSLLVAVVREAEQGITREDLINVILTEATQLNSSSAGNIISQAMGGLGLIHLNNGTYSPTERGLELLKATDPAQVLRSPLIGRVFGMGHLLCMLADNPGGVGQTDAARRLQTLVPSWKTTQPGSYIVAWAKLAGLVRSETVGGLARLTLTDDGEDYVAALPDDFEERWTILPSPGEDAEDELTEKEVAADLSRAASETYGIDAIIADGCFLARSTLSDALALLTRKKNLVIQGPPGTGKTWLAKRLGYALVGAKDQSRLMSVQFQPSLSYEDFVRGWRPNGTGGLQLADGAFLEAMAAANAEPDRPFVLVIEEINRGNPAQILGELLTLLEADKRNESEALRLAYPRTLNERVYIPANLHVIGTMNLADRSLALVDLALRRRFAFMTLAPALDKPWRVWCRERGAPDELMDEIQRRMHGLNAEIEADHALGGQFKIGHSFVTPPETLTNASPEAWQAWFAAVVDNEIVPLLEEYWYDKPERAADQAKSLRIAS